MALVEPAPHQWPVLHAIVQAGLVIAGVEPYLPIGHCPLQAAEVRPAELP